MDTFQQFKLDTGKQLNRELTTKEVMFLQWIYTRHKEREQNKSLFIHFINMNEKSPPLFNYVKNE